MRTKLLLCEGHALLSKGLRFVGIESSQVEFPPPLVGALANGKDYPLLGSPVPHFEVPLSQDAGAGARPWDDNELLGAKAQALCKCGLVRSQVLRGELATLGPLGVLRATAFAPACACTSPPALALELCLHCPSLSLSAPYALKLRPRWRRGWGRGDPRASSDPLGRLVLLAGAHGGANAAPLSSFGVQPTCEKLRTGRAAAEPAAQVRKAHLARLPEPELRQRRAS